MIQMLLKMARRINVPGRTLITHRKVYKVDKENFLPLGHRDAKIDEACKILHRLMLRRAFDGWKDAAAENKPNDSSQ